MKLSPEPLYRVVQKLPLHPNQQKVWDVFFSNKYRFFVINAGRRFGKSTVCLAIAIELAVNYGLKVWWVGKTYRDAGKQWRDAKQILNSVYTSKNETDRRMEFKFTLPDGTKLNGELTFRSADKPDNLRGDGLHLLIIDEAAFQDQAVWTVLRPALSDYRGRCIFISTPNGHNWFHAFFERGRLDNRKQFPRWWSKHFTSYDNPTIKSSEIDSAKKDMTDTEFRIEHMAEFIDNIGKVFSNVSKNATAVFTRTPDNLHHYSMGIDLARTHDSTIVSVMDMNTFEQVFMFRMVSEEWDYQKKKIVETIKVWEPDIIYADSTAVGQPVVEDLQKMVYPRYTIQAFVMGTNTKPHLIQQLAVKLENNQIRILNDDTEIGQLQINELQAYEVKKSVNELKWVYGAPRGTHDDTVIALALACLALQGKTRAVEMYENPFFKKTFIEQEPRRDTFLTEYARKSHDLQEKLLKEAGYL